MVGRLDERTALRDALARAEAGEPGVLLVTGDAGVGKTRLTRELVTMATDRAEGTRRRVGA